MALDLLRCASIAWHVASGVSLNMSVFIWNHVPACRLLIITDRTLACLILFWVVAAGYCGIDGSCFQNVKFIQLRGGDGAWDFILFFTVVSIFFVSFCSCDA